MGAQERPTTEATPRPTVCPVCRKTDGPIIWREGCYSLRACPCGVSCLTSMPEAVDFTADMHAEGYYRHPAHFRLAHVRSAQSSGKLLEIGCGTGWFLAAAQAEGYDVEGLEPHSGRAAIARQRGLPVREEFVEEADLPPHYDVIFHVDLLSHFPDPVRALKAMAAALAPGGVICLEVGVVGGISPFWYRLAGGVGLPAHHWLYSRGGLYGLFARAGLEVREMRCFGLIPGWMLVALRKALWPLLGKVIEAPVSATGTQSRLHSYYDWLQYLLRYKVGRWMPNVGPQTAFFTLIKKTP